METLMHMHGGDLDAIEREYGIPKNEISDFSGNINPLGFPKKAAAKLAENNRISVNRYNIHQRSIYFGIIRIFR